MAFTSSNKTFVGQTRSGTSVPSSLSSLELRLGPIKHAWFEETETRGSSVRLNVENDFSRSRPWPRSPKPKSDRWASGFRFLESSVLYRTQSELQRAQRIWDACAGSCLSRECFIAWCEIHIKQCNQSINITSIRIECAVCASHTQTEFMIAPWPVTSLISLYSVYPGSYPSSCGHRKGTRSMSVWKSSLQSKIHPPTAWKSGMATV